MLILRQLRSPGRDRRPRVLSRNEKRGAFRGPLLPLSPKWKSAPTVGRHQKQPGQVSQPDLKVLKQASFVQIDRNWRIAPFLVNARAPPANAPIEGRRRQRQVPASAADIPITTALTDHQPEVAAVCTIGAADILAPASFCHVHQAYLLGLTKWRTPTSSSNRVTITV